MSDRPSYHERRLRREKRTYEAAEIFVVLVSLLGAGVLGLHAARWLSLSGEAFEGPMLAGIVLVIICLSVRGRAGEIDRRLEAEEADAYRRLIQTEEAS
jgi:hypothetical protein